MFLLAIRRAPVERTVHRRQRADGEVEKIPERIAVAARQLPVNRHERAAIDDHVPIREISVLENGWSGRGDAREVLGHVSAPASGDRVAYVVVEWAASDVVTNLSRA